MDVDTDLSNIWYQINAELGDMTGRVDTTKPFLLVDVDTHTYYAYIKLMGDRAQGYSRHMFE